MSQRSNGLYGDPDEEQDDATAPQDSYSASTALPEDAADRGSESLLSPNFQLPKEVDTAADEAMAAPPDDNIPQASQSPTVQAGPPPQTIRGRENPDLTNAFSALDSANYAPAPDEAQQVQPTNNAIATGAYQQGERVRAQQQAQAEQEVSRRKSGLMRYLKSNGVETQINPDGSESIATDAAGNHIWKPVKSDPFLDPDSGKWVRQVRDSAGAVNHVDLQAAGEYHVDPKTGDMLAQNGAGQKIKIGTDAPTVAKIQISGQRNALKQQNTADTIALAQTAQAVTPLRKQFMDLQNSTPTVGGVPQGNTVRKLEEIAQRDPNSDDSKTAQQVLDKWQADHPEYVQAKAALTAAQQSIAQRREAITGRKLTALTLATNPNAPAVGALAAPGFQDSASPGMAPGSTSADAIQIQTAADAATQKTSQLTALPGTLAKLQAAGVTVPDVTARIRQLQRLANPPAPDEPPPGKMADLGKRFLAGIAEPLNSALEGVAHWTGATGLENYAKLANQNAKGFVDQSRNSDLTSKIAETAGNIVATIPAAMLGTAAATALAPETAAVGIVAGLAGAGRIAVSAMPIAFQFAASSGANARDQYLAANPGDTAGAEKAGSKASFESLYALPAYMFGSAVGGAVLKGALAKTMTNPELINPFLKGALSLFTHSASNVAASTAIRAVRGEPVMPTVENSLQDVGFGIQGAFGEGMHQARAVAPGAPAKAFFAGQVGRDMKPEAKTAYIPIAQAILDGKEPSIVGLDKMVSDPAVPVAQQTQARGMAELMRANAADFLKNKDLPQTHVPTDSPERSYREALKQQDNIQGQYETADNPADKAAAVDQVTANGETMHGILQARIDNLPEDSRAQIAKAIDPTVSVPAAEEQLRTSPNVAFAAQSIGSDPQVRAAYVEPGKENALYAMREKTPDPAAAGRLADQHVGMAVARDLWGVVSDTRPINEMKEAALSDPTVGLLVRGTDANGQTVAKLTHDALPLLTDAHRAAVAQNPGRFLIDDASGTPGVLFHQHVRAGQQTGVRMFDRPSPVIQPRQHNVTITTRGPGETVPMERTVPIQAHSEVDAHARAVAKFQGMGHEVIESKIRTPEEIKAQVPDSKTAIPMRAGIEPFRGATPKAPVEAIWSNKDHDAPVKITGIMGERNGETYLRTEGGTGVPASEVRVPKSAASEPSGDSTPATESQPRSKSTGGKLDAREESSSQRTEEPRPLAGERKEQSPISSGESTPIPPDAEVLNAIRAVKSAGGMKSKAELEDLIAKARKVKLKAGADNDAYDKGLKALTDQEISKLPSHEKVDGVDSFTTEGKRALGKILPVYLRNRGLFDALGVKAPEFGKITNRDASGLIVIGGKLVFDGDLLHENFQSLEGKGVSPEEWAKRALNEEVIHLAQRKAAQKAGVSFDQFYRDLRNDPKLDPQLLEAARQAYNGFDQLTDFQQGAEIARMVIQGRWTGTITERIFKAIQHVVDYLKGVKVVDSDLLRDAVTQTESVLNDARRKVAGSGRDLDEVDQDAVKAMKRPAKESVPAPTPKPFHQEVRDAVESIRSNPASWMGDRKVFISHAYDAWKKQTGRPESMDEFKAALASGLQNGNVRLSRADFTHGLKPEDLANSLIKYGNEDFHFINQPKEDGLGASGVSEYGMRHRPNPEGPQGHDISTGGQDDVYEHPDWHSGQDPKSAAFRESVSAIRKMRGKPESDVMIYRSGPEGELHAGDWVSPSKEYAKQHGMDDSDSAKDSPVHSFTVKAKDLRWPGDEIGEFGYYPESETQLGASSSKDEWKTPEQRKTDELGFYSTLRKVVTAKIPNRASADQILATLDPAKSGVKKEEMEWMGLPQFLEGKKTVTKQELLDFIDSNPVPLKEVVKTATQKFHVRDSSGWGSDNFDTEEEANAHADDLARSAAKEDPGASIRKGDPILEYTVKSADGEILYRGTDSAKLHRIHDANEDSEISEDESGYHRWEGVDSRGNPAEDFDTKSESEEWLRDQQDSAEGRYRDDLRVVSDDEDNTQFSQYAHQGGENYKEILTTLPVNGEAFKSSHYDEPNIIVHTREADHEDTEGNRVRLLEEIQSDWHQKGRKEGYGDTVPDAPFKKSWHELAFKRALRRAVEDGMDKIAWTTGEQQADRYDLAKKLESVSAKPNGGGKFNIVARNKQGGIAHMGDHDASELPEIVGVDLAKKIMADTNGGEEGKKHVYSGLDLQVGGEGMKGFYDKILPDFARKYVKQWGGKVGVSEIETEDGPKAVHSIEITPEMKDAVMDGQALFASSTREKLKEFSDATKAFFAPPTVNETAQRTAGITRENVAELASRRERTFSQMKGYQKELGSMPEQDQLNFIHSYETGQKQLNPRLDQIAAVLRQSFDDRVQDVRALGTGKLQKLIENYFPRIWADPDEAEKVYRQIFSKKPLEGSGNFLKKRSIPTVRDGMQWRVYDKEGTFQNTAPDEATAKAQADSIGGRVGKPLKLVTTNPIDLAILKNHEMDRFITAHRILNEMKEQGLAVYVPANQPLPQGYKWIDDKIGTVMGKGDPQPMSNAFKQQHNIQGVGQRMGQVQVIRGKYAAPEDAARVINNYLSPGLAGNLLFDTLRAVGNHMNMFQLGFSGFHAGFETLNSIISSAALSVKQAFDGELKQALGNVVKIPLAPYHDVALGSKVLKEMMNPGSQRADIAKLADAVIRAGGRGKMDASYQTGAIHKFFDAWRQGAYGTALMRIPALVLTSFGHPLMAEYVPRLKLGVFARMAEYELGRMDPSTDTNGQRKILGAAWDSVENRFGQMAYDNLFWNKTLKDLAMLSTRSVGWNLGTIREIGGAIKDLPGAVLGGGITHRIAYAVALPVMVGIAGAIIQYLHTGKGPEELRDYFAPKTGEIMPDGTDERVNAPSYMKDEFSYGSHPFRTIQNKIGPLYSSIAQMIGNHDYYGTEIVAPDDGITKKAISEGKFIAKQFVPFSVSGGKQRVNSGPIAKAENFFGITPAPADTIRSKAMNIIHEFREVNRPSGQTSEVAAKRDVKRQLLNRLRVIPGRQPDMSRADAIAKAKQDGLNPQEITAVAKESTVDPKLLPFRGLPLNIAQKAFDAGTPEERRVWAAPLMAMKGRAMRNGQVVTN